MFASLPLPLGLLLLQNLRKFQSHLNFSSEKQDFEIKQPLETSLLNTGSPPTFFTEGAWGGRREGQREISLKISKNLGNEFSLFLFFVISDIRSCNSRHLTLAQGLVPGERGYHPLLKT